jgi:hypothetical protein
VQTGTRALAKATRSVPLPEVALLSPLYAEGVVPRQGQLITVFGQPGAGKSTFVEWYINAMDVTCLYFSADMDAQDAITRLGAMRTGIKVADITDAVKHGGADFVHGELEDSKIQWCFDSSPTLDDIADELSAYVELHDAYPKVIVIDNAMNIEGQTEDENGGLRLVFRELHRLAHETGICVIILHHAREEGDSRVPAPRSALQGKVGQLPAIILSVALDGINEIFRISAVKCRSGKQDPSGKHYHQISAQPEYASFDVFRQAYPTVSYGDWDSSQGDYRG